MIRASLGLACAVAIWSGLTGDQRCQGEDRRARSAFEPGDISIGDPIALPFGSSRDEPAARRDEPRGDARDRPDDRHHPADARPTEHGAVPPADQRYPSAAPAAPAQQPQSAVPPTASAGQGWLGLAIGESSVPGRWVVDTVAPIGPAAAAGIVPGDEVRGINGVPLRNADEVAQALTAIAPGQVVAMAIARGEQIRDVDLTATARPQAPAFAAAPPIAPPSVTMPVSPAAAMPPPSTIAPPPAVAAVAPPAAFPSPSVAAAWGAPAPAPAHPAFPPSSPIPSAAAALDRATAAPPPVQPPPSSVAPASPTSPGGRTALGVRTVPIDEGLRARFQLPDATGAYVIGVVQDLPASKAGVPPGSVIVSLGDRPVHSPDDLTRLVTAGPVGRPVTLDYVLPGGTAQRASVVLQTLEQPFVEALAGPAELQAGSVPALQTTPPGFTTPATTARRPVPEFTPQSAAAVRAEIGWLRRRLLLLEQRLEAVAR